MDRLVSLLVNGSDRFAGIRILNLMNDRTYKLASMRGAAPGRISDSTKRYRKLVTSGHCFPSELPNTNCLSHRCYRYDRMPSTMKM